MQSNYPFNWFVARGDTDRYWCQSFLPVTALGMHPCAAVCASRRIGDVGWIRTSNLRRMRPLHYRCATTSLFLTRSKTVRGIEPLFLPDW